MARETAKHLGTNHHEVRLTQEDQFGTLDELLNSAIDEPFGDQHYHPFLYLRRLNLMQPSHYQDGSDELFGGYRKYQGTVNAYVVITARRKIFTQGHYQHSPHRM